MDNLGLSFTAEPPAKRSNPREHKMQAAVIEWARYQEWKYPGLELLHASLNGVPLPPASAAKASAAGMLAGIPDLFLPVARYPYCGLYVELKCKGNKPSPAQLEKMASLRRNGYRCEVVYDDWAEVKCLLVEYLSQPDLFEFVHPRPLQHSQP